jgi:acyl carrier protein
MSPEENLVREVHALLREKLYVEVDSPDADLLATGALDSVTLVQLLLHLEERFQMQLPLHELEIEDFSSVAGLARLVAARNHGRSVAAGGN